MCVGIPATGYWVLLLVLLQTITTLVGEKLFSVIFEHSGKAYKDSDYTIIMLKLIMDSVTFRKLFKGEQNHSVVK